MLFATSFVRDEEAWVLRYKPWLNYYRKSPLAAIPIILIDDGSSFIPNDKNIRVIDSLEKIDLSTNCVNFFRFPNNLGRSSTCSYPGWWRSFLFSREIALFTEKKKIVHIESDAYILSPKFFQLILEMDNCWFAPWLNKYKMPETGIQVITQDHFYAMLQVEKDTRLNIKMAEEILPLTCVPKNLIGDRYGEFKKNRWIFRSKKFDRFSLFKNEFFFTPIPQNADFVTQVTSRQFKDSRLKIALTY